MLTGVFLKQDNFMLKRLFYMKGEGGREGGKELKHESRSLFPLNFQFGNKHLQIDSEKMESEL